MGGRTSALWTTFLKCVITRSARLKEFYCSWLKFAEQAKNLCDLPNLLSQEQQEDSVPHQMSPTFEVAWQQQVWTASNVTSPVWLQIITLLLVQQRTQHIPCPVKKPIPCPEQWECDDQVAGSLSFHGPSSGSSSSRTAAADPKYEGNMLLPNIQNDTGNNTASHARRLEPWNIKQPAYAAWLLDPKHVKTLSEKLLPNKR
jgi:hypothetical protein